MSFLGRQEIRYGFAVGRVRVLETRLLSRSTFERLIDAPTFDEQKRILSETHFGRYLESAATATDVERAIDESLVGLYEEFLERSELPEPVVRFFRLPYDYTNLKSAVKALVVPGATPGRVRGLGSLPADAFDHIDRLPDEFRDVAEGLVLAEEAPSSEDVDAAIDRALFAALLEEARRSKLGFLVTLAHRYADIANVKVLMRASVARRSTADVQRMLVGGGGFDAQALAPSVRKQPVELASEIIARGAVRHVVPDDLADLTRLDVVLDAATAELTHHARMVATGPEPVLAYVLARQTEATSLRALLVGKLVGLDRDTVVSRLRGVAA